MICSNQNVGAIQFVCNDTNQILNLRHCTLTSLKNLVFCHHSLANGVDGIVVDVNHIFSGNQITLFSLLHTKKLFISNGHTVFIFCLKHFLSALSSFCGKPIAIDSSIIMNLEGTMRKQCCHTILCYGREDTLHCTQRSFALCFPNQRLCKFRCNFIGEDRIQLCSPHRVKETALINRFLQNLLYLPKCIFTP